MTPLETYLEKCSVIRHIKNDFETKLCEQLNLHLVPGPMTLPRDSCYNDHLAANEPPVTFGSAGQEFEVVHSLAKWKRVKLTEESFSVGAGIVTNMVALRQCDNPDDTHSHVVRQWDWELVISPEQRSQDFLKAVVSKIYSGCIWPLIKKYMPEELSREFPESLYFWDPDSCSIGDSADDDANREVLEYNLAKKHKAVFLTKISESRAPDYDDWTLNGDIVVWHHGLERHLELSSMGIRVNAERLTAQLESLGRSPAGEYHQGIIDSRLLNTIGGGIGESRILMFLMNTKISDVVEDNH